MEAHEEVTIRTAILLKIKAFIHFSGYYSAIQRAIIYYVVDQPKVGEQLI